MVTESHVLSADRVARIAELASADLDVHSAEPTKKSHALWVALRRMGSSLWLDTGDIDAAAPLYTAEFEALTTNNTLLNKEVQKGIYDKLIAESARELQDLTDSARVIEIAFILNARHGLRLVQRFGGKVSVELHTDLAHDVERSLHYARRYHAICPSHFIVKLPLTPAGMLATRQLSAEGIPVNFTLGFSARQNHLAAVLARPAYVNVFLGRLNAYVSDNKLGNGINVGEKTMLASQRTVTGVSKGRVKHIAASLRSADQVTALAGVDVFTMPTSVAADAVEQLSTTFTNHLTDNPVVTWGDDIAVDALRSETLWDIDSKLEMAAADLDARPPTTPEELIHRLQAAEQGDLFPILTPDDHRILRTDGKIPAHQKWAERIAAGELAIDTLLNLAALHAFSVDQEAMDERIRKAL